MSGAPAIIRVIDVEATGFTAPDHKPVEIGFCDLRADMVDFAGEPAGWQVSGGTARLCHPGRDIPPEASAVHRIVAEDVQSAALWDHIAASGIYWPDDRGGVPIVGFAAHSAKTERQWITDEMVGGRPWLDTYKVALRLISESPTHSVQGLRFYMKPVGIDREIADNAHRAYPDAYVTAFILCDMLNASPPVTLAQMIEWSNQPALQIWCHLGDWRGHRWSEVDSGFLHWILGKDFEEDIVFTVKHELKRREDEWRASQPENPPNDPEPVGEERPF